MSVWREAQAPDSGRTYYYNTETRQTVWERPAEMDSAAAPTTPATATPTGPAAEQLTQEHLAAGWQATKTPEGRTYYYKRGTQETSWRLPDLPDSRNQQVAGPGSFAAASWDRGSDAPSRRYDRREDRDRGLPDKPGFDGGRGKPWEQQGGGFRGAMPAKADEPDYATAEQARDAFFKVLRKHNIKYNTPWPDALRAVIRERDYRAIKDAKDRKAAFEDYCIEQRVEEKSREKERHAKLRDEFRAMLKTHEEIKHYTRWKTARPMIEREAVFRNAGDEDERRSLFDEYILELKKRHIDQETAGRRRALDQLEMLVRSFVIDPNTKWATAQDTIMKSDKFMNDDAFEPLHKLDVILAFESHLKRLEQEINHAKQADKSLQQTRDRQARDGFRSLLQEKLKAGVFTAGSKWQDFVPHIENEERYINMIGTSGSSPLDMFWDFVEDEERKVRSKRNDALDILDEQRYEMSGDTSLSAFAEVMGRDRRTSSWTSQDMKLVFEKLMEKIHKRAEEDKALAERSQRKAVDALRSVIKHLEPPVNENDTFEDIQPKLEKYKEYQALDNEARRIAFSKHIRRLQDKAEDAERDRARRERDRTLDRERDRDRDRDYRRSYDYERERERDRDRRHRTRTPEVDAYEADRRKAQADRERSFRKPSFGLTPPPRERRDDRSDRERDRGGDRDRDRRGDRYESMYERERREREAERERNYASRADPRDRGKVSTLDYGDDDVVGSRPGSIRKRRESDDVSMASKRDNKRSRQSKEPEGKSMAAEKEDVAMQSGSEEGEIEEV